MLSLFQRGIMLININKDRDNNMKQYQINFNNILFAKYNQQATKYWKSVNSNTYSDIYKTKHSYDEFNLVNMELDSQGNALLKTKCNSYLCATSRFGEMLNVLHIIQDNDLDDFVKLCNQYLIERGVLKYGK